MAKHLTARVQHHSLMFWFSPLVIALMIAAGLFIIKPYLKDCTDHLLVMLRILFI